MKKQLKEVLGHIKRKAIPFEKAAVKASIVMGQANGLTKETKTPNKTLAKEIIRHGRKGRLVEHPEVMLERLREASARLESVADTVGNFEDGEAGAHLIHHLEDIVDALRIKEKEESEDGPLDLEYIKELLAESVPEAYRPFATKYLELTDENKDDLGVCFSTLKVSTGQLRLYVTGDASSAFTSYSRYTNALLSAYFLLRFNETAIRATQKRNKDHAKKNVKYEEPVYITKMALDTLDGIDRLIEDLTSSKNLDYVMAKRFLDLFNSNDN